MSEKTASSVGLIVPAVVTFCGRAPGSITARTDFAGRAAPADG